MSAGTADSNVTSGTTAKPEVTSAVATAGRVVGNASYGFAVVFAESLTASGFDGIYTCLGRLNDTDLPQYTILQYSLTVGKTSRITISSINYKSQAIAGSLKTDIGNYEI